MRGFWAGKTGHGQRTAAVSGGAGCEPQACQKMDKQILEVRLATSHCAASGDAARERKALRDRIRVIPERKGGSAHDGGRPWAKPARNEAKNVKV